MAFRITPYGEITNRLETQQSGPALSEYMRRGRIFWN